MADKAHVYHEDRLIEGEHNYETITDGIGRLVLNQKVHRRNWLNVFLVGFLLVNVAHAND